MLARILEPEVMDTPDEARECRRAFGGLEREVGRETAEVRILDRHLDVEFVWRLATHPRVLEPVEAVLGPERTSVVLGVGLEEMLGDTDVFVDHTHIGALPRTRAILGIGVRVRF